MRYVKRKNATLWPRINIGQESHGNQSSRHGWFDRIVVTTNDIEATGKFYERAPGCAREVFQGSDWQSRYALRFGDQ